MEFKKDFEELHGHDIQKLQSVLMANQINENDCSRLFRENKYVVKMSSYSFELLINFLHSHGFTQILAIVNQHLNVTSI